MYAQVRVKKHRRGDHRLKSDFQHGLLDINPVDRSIGTSPAELKKQFLLEKNVSRTYQKPANMEKFRGSRHRRTRSKKTLPRARSHPPDLLNKRSDVLNMSNKFIPNFTIKNRPRTGCGMPRSNSRPNTTLNRKMTTSMSRNKMRYKQTFRNMCIDTRRTVKVRRARPGTPILRDKTGNKIYRGCPLEPRKADTRKQFPVRPATHQSYLRANLIHNIRYKTITGPELHADDSKRSLTRSGCSGSEYRY